MFSRNRGRTVWVCQQIYLNISPKMNLVIANRIMTSHEREPTMKTICIKQENVLNKNAKNNEGIFINLRMKFFIRK